MKKYLTAVLFCFTCFQMFGSDPWYEYDFSYVNKLPEVRQKCLEENRLTGNESTPERRVKQFAYYECLKEMITQVMDRHYFHGEFPESPITVMEEYSKLLAGAEYPQSVATGASYYGSLIIDHQTRLAEDLLSKMVSSILDLESYGEGALTNELSYEQWLALWKKAKHE